MSTIGIFRERALGETRVALVPEVIEALKKKLGAHVLVESKAGEASGFYDQEYQAVGAQIVDSREEILQRSNIVAAVDGQQFFDCDHVEGKTLIGLFDPFFALDGLKRLAAKKATVLSLDVVPRISRAQSLDVLSSQANIAGYVAVLMAASKIHKIFPLMMTAAGTIKPAKVLIVGAGVAGLSAIATAKRLGALVFAYDVRAAAKEQVESLGAKFVTLNIGETGEGQGGYAKSLSEEAAQKLKAALSHFAKDMDVVITTAQIPGKMAPMLFDDSLFEHIKDGAVIIDMACKSGGNVPGSKLNEWQKIGKPWVYGAHNLSCQAAKDASFTFAKNVLSLLELFPKNGDLDLTDEIFSQMVLCERGEWVNPSFKNIVTNEADRGNI